MTGADEDETPRVEPAGAMGGSVVEEPSVASAPRLPPASRRMLVGIGVAVAGFLVVGVSFRGDGPDGARSAATPMSDDEVLERLRPAGALPSADASGSDSAKLRKAATTDLRAALASARTLGELGRSSGDPRLFGHAEAALAQWMAAPAVPSTAYVLRAAARGGRHDFEGAWRDLERAVRLDPRDGQAWLSRGVLASVRGDVLAALESCAGVGRSGAAFAEALCSGHALGLVGQLDEATQRVASAHARWGARASASERGWAHGLLGELSARRGAAGSAEAHMRAAWALERREPAARVPLADLLLDLGRDQEAHELARPGSGTHEGLALRRAIAEARLGHAPSNVTRVLAARFQEARAREDETHLREAAWFQLEVLRQPNEALRSALRNFAWQREPVDARLVLQAAYAAHAPSAAAVALEWLRRVGHVDARLASLRAALGDAR